MMENGETPSRQNAQEQLDVFMDLIMEFQAVTGMEDMEESRQILERNNWDLLAAIGSHMGFEAESQHFNRDETGTNATMISPVTNSSSSTSNGSDPRSLRSIGMLGFMYRLVTKPIDLLFKYIWHVISFGLRILRFQYFLTPSDPLQEVLNFIQEYERKYGGSHPVFFQGTYGQALDHSKKELQFLLVYLHSNDHESTPAFCNNVMKNPNFQELCKTLLFWACSVSKAEGLRTSQALKENTYPFLALIALKNNKMTIVTRVEGVTDPAIVIAAIEQGMADNQGHLEAARQSRMEQCMNRSLREEQDAAYLASLKADQEKERKRKEERERKLQEELNKQKEIEEENQRLENLKLRKEEARRNLKPEPSNDHPDLVKVVIKLPCGTRLERKFLLSDSLEDLHQFVLSNPDAPNFFDIATNFPKRTIPCQKTSDNPTPPTFSEAGLGRKEMLFVYDLEC